MTSDEQEMSEHVMNNTPVNEADCSNGISGLLSTHNSKFSTSPQEEVEACDKDKQGEYIEEGE